MVAMTKAARRKPFELHVVLAVRRSHDHKGRPRRLEQHALESREPRWIEMFDDFNYGRRVEAFDAVVAVDQRSVQQVDSCALPGGHSIEVQALARMFERAK